MYAHYTHPTLHYDNIFFHRIEWKYTACFIPHNKSGRNLEIEILAKLGNRWNGDGITQVKLRAVREVGIGGRMREGQDAAERASLQ